MDKNTYNGRSILRALGTGEVQATLALQQIQLAPRSSDPDAGATIVIVKAVQRGMNQLGCPMQTTGRVDAKTKLCLAQVAGPEWEGRSWLSITKEIVLMRDAGIKLPGLDNEYQGVGAVSFGQKYGTALVVGGLLLLAMKYK